MDRELYEASLTGNTTTLQKLLHEDELMLDKALASTAPETPLHIAALRGHVEFAAQILCLRPELAKEFNSQGLSPLHLASANGHVGVIKELLKAAPDSISCRDREGRTPLHTAAAKGRIDVFEELTCHNPELTGELTSRGETVLHLCVKYEHMESLTRFIAMISDAELVNRKDDNGNTVLHLSTAMKHVPMIKLLIEKTRVQVNTRNTSGLTALDVLAVCPRESIGDMEIEQFLRRKGAKRAWELTQLIEVDHPLQENTPDHHISQESDVVKSLKDLSQQLETQWNEQMTQKSKDDKRNTVMLIAILIVTIAFQGILTPPGGYWPDDSQPSSNSSAPASGPAQETHVAGTAILSEKKPLSLAFFWFFCALSFVSSLLLIIGTGVLFSKDRLLSVACWSMYAMFIAGTVPITTREFIYSTVMAAILVGFVLSILINVYQRCRNKNGPSTDSNRRDNVTEAGPQP